MTTLIVNAIDVLGKDIRDGVVRISSSNIQYSHGSMVLPEFQEKELVNGQATFSNVQPGLAIVQFHWDLNRTATVRATVPTSGTVTLASLTLQEYDRDPAVVSQVTEAVSRTEQALARVKIIGAGAEDSANRAEKAQAEAESARDDASDHRDEAKAAATAAGQSAQAASESAADAQDSENAADTHRQAAQQHEGAAKAAQTSAASSATSAAGSAQDAAASAAAASTSEGNSAQSATDAAAHRQAALEHRDDAQAHADRAAASATSAASSETSASGSETRARQSEQSAAASAEAADNSANSAAADRAAAQEARDKAQTSAINAADSEASARDSASKAEGHEAAAEQHAGRAQTIRYEMQGVIDSSIEVVRDEFAGYEAGAQAQADRAKAEADRAASEVDARVSELVDGAPEQFDTLRELADGIMENQDTVQAVINGLAGKADVGRVEDIEQEIADYIDVTPRDEEGRPYWSYGLETQEWTDPATGEVHTAYIPKDGELADIPEAYIPNGANTTKFGVEMTVVNTSDEDGIFAVSFIGEGAFRTPNLWRPITPVLSMEYDTNAFATLIRAGSMMTYRSVEHLVAGSLDSNFRLTLADEVWTEGLGERVTQPAHPEDFGIVDLKIYRVHDRITALYQANQATSIARRLQNEMAPLEHTHEIDDVTGLREELNRAAGVEHTHPISEVDGLRQELDSKADSGHKHSWSEIEGKPSTYKPSSHKHTSADITDTTFKIGNQWESGKVLTASPSGEIYRYGTAEPDNTAALVNKFYVDREVGKKADTGHKHDWSDITGTPPSDLGYNVMTPDHPAHDYPVGFSYAMSNGNSHNWNAAIDSDVDDYQSSGFVLIMTMRQGSYSGSTTQLVFSYDNRHKPVYLRKWNHGDGEWGPFRSLTDDGHTHTGEEIERLGDGLITVNGVEYKLSSAYEALNDGYLDLYFEKANKSHTHTMSDIKDMVLTDWINHSSHSGKVVRTRSDGFVHGGNPKLPNHVANKQYVDDQNVWILSEMNNRPALHSGYGPPGTIPYSVPGDMYLDLDTMEIHKLT